MKICVLGSTIFGALMLWNHGYSQKVLESKLNRPIPVVSEVERWANSVNYALKRRVARRAQFQAIQDAAKNDSNSAISYNIGAHHQLKSLPLSLAKNADKAEYYNDILIKYSEGIEDNKRVALMEYNTKKIEYTKYPDDRSVPVYPDCNKICDSNSKYRTLDGKCNNLNSCLNGASGTTYRRLLPAQYGPNGSPRPANTNPWDISRHIFGITSNVEERIHTGRNLSQMLMTFGQFLAHDMTATPSRSVLSTDGKPIQVDCIAVDDQYLYEDCRTMRTTKTWLSASFVRSAPGLIDKNNTYRFGQREQVNGHSAYIDASHLYGSTFDENKLLVDLSTGLMKVQQVSAVPAEKFPPTSPNQYCEGATGNECFISGDGRLNIHLGMMMLHTLFTRMHNYLATDLATRHPSWKGNKIYEEVRRVNGAIIQSITYNQYLPLILGPDLMTKYGLDPKTGSTYDPSVDASIINSFAAAGFRFGHSQIYNNIRMATNAGDLSAIASLASTMFNPDRFYSASNGHAVMKRYLMGLSLDQCEAVDTTFGATIVLNLFKSKTPDRPSHLSKGVSLPALNIERGRDHGLPTCGDFMDLIKETTGDIPPNINDAIKRSKDLFHCGLEEPHLPGAEVGLTFGHIIASQFQKTMLGDRFFYSHDNTDSATSFSADARKAIEQVTLSQLFCKFVNTVPEGKKPNDIKFVFNAFKTKDAAGNSLFDCDDDILPTFPSLAIILP